MNSKNLVVERVFDVDMHTVWRAITEKELMKQWYFDLEDFRAEVGFRFEFWADDDKGKRWKHLCEITDVNPETKLVYSWKYDGYSGISYVMFELFDQNGSTRLKLTHSGIESFPAIPELALHNFEAGWNSIINTSLKEFFEARRWTKV